MNLCYYVKFVLKQRLAYLLLKFPYKTVEYYSRTQYASTLTKSESKSKLMAINIKYIKIP